jgi:chromosome replication initiation : membrane attachment protein
MTKEKVLPADTFIVFNKTILHDEDRKILLMLYQPIIGYQAISLYFTLWNNLDRREIFSKECTHHLLMTNMQLRLSSIVEARERLEAVGLLKTYLKKQNINNFVYELYSPISPYDFLNNPVLATTLFNNVGKYEYEKILEYYQVPKINLKEYEEITCSFTDIFESSNVTEFEIVTSNLQKYSSNKLNITPKIDLDNIVSLIPDDMLNVRSLTKDTKDLIYKISFIYNYDDACMSELIRNSLNDKKMIDKKMLRIQSRKLYQFENSGKLPSLMYRNQPEYLRKPVGDVSKKAKIIYQFETTSPYDFLASKYNGSKPSKSDLGILEFLLLDMNLNPGVVNVLVDFVLKIDHNKLTKSYVEKIASQWAKSKIETVEEAMTIAETEYKNRRKVKKNPKVLEEKPSWFDQDIEKQQANLEEQKEIEKMLETI